MERCRHEATVTRRDENGVYVKRCQACGLHTHPHASFASADAEWKVRLVLDKQLHGDDLTAGEEVVLAYGGTSSVCGQNLI
jgi:hypothetical protein